jgi:CBS domain-containing protein
MRPQPQRVESIMTREVVTVTPATGLKDAAELLVGRRISGLPVCDEQQSVVGVLSEGDLLVKEGGPETVVGVLFTTVVETKSLPSVAKAQARTVGEAMTSPAITVEPRETVAAAARTMVDRGINRLPVVADGKLVGIVTRADVIRTLTRSDEEIATEIRRAVIEPMHWVRSDSVTVDVTDGVVGLSGSVESQYDAELLERRVVGVPGVIGLRSVLAWHLDRKGRPLQERTRRWPLARRAGGQEPA